MNRRFAVGYQQKADGEVFADVVKDYAADIAEVYFAWPGEASGRAPLPPQTLEQVQWELERLTEKGIGLNLLLNASCYGTDALSADFEKRIRVIIGELATNVGLKAITTMSPVVAATAKKHFPEIDVRASVNMRVGTVKGMQYVARYFNSYCLQREYNRDMERIMELEAWAADNGKQLHALVNSGCLNFCSFQTFHDNVVAHETRVNEMENVVNLTTLCREYYSDRHNWTNFLQGSSWIRPEDILKHRQIFTGGYKLATRMHDNPRMVINAYVKGDYRGNLLDLLEPGFGPLFYPGIIDNKRFPEDWFEHQAGCDDRCCGCEYCSQVLEKVLVNVHEVLNCGQPGR